MAPDKGTPSADDRTSYTYLLDNLIRPRLGRIHLSQIASETVSSWRSDMLVEGLAAAAVRNAYVLLRQILEATVDPQRIASNPCRVRGAAQVPDSSRMPPTLKLPRR